MLQQRSFGCNHYFVSLEFRNLLLIVFCDKLGVTYLLINPIRHSRSKHVEIDIHFVRDYVTNRVLDVRILDVRFVSTKN